MTGISQKLKPSHQVIADWIDAESLVLDVGCGTGELAQWLRAHKQVDARGIDKNQQRVNQAIATGVPVIHGDADTDLAHYPDNAYDYVISSQTIQAMKDPKAVLSELARVGKRVIVSVPNFGHWRNRLYLGLRGRMPVTSTLSYEWYETPNIHFCTLIDFIELAEEMDLKVVKQIAMKEGVIKPFHGKHPWVNLTADVGVFLLER